MNANVNYSLIERVLLGIDSKLRATNSKNSSIGRENPAHKIKPSVLSTDEKQQAIEMMRVNHTGEVCAQALYHGQALFARDKDNREKLLESAQEENDHLNWCKQRLDELNGKTSTLEPLWYTGALTIGALASLAGDKFSLGFLAETEFQVTDHLSGHLDKMSVHDKKSRAILEQMKTDELKHATAALERGGSELSIVVKALMRASAKVMTTVAAKI